MSEQKVRGLLADGYLEPVDAELGSGDRQVRYVTGASVTRYAERARAAGASSLKLCAYCNGKRYRRAGTLFCGPCWERIDEVIADRRIKTQERKNAWWRMNGRQWRRSRRALQPGEWASIFEVLNRPTTTKASSNRARPPMPEHNREEANE